MEIKIKLKNALVYSDKKTNETMTRLGYEMYGSEYCQNDTKFKGYAELSSFYSGDSVFNKITSDMFDKEVVALVESQVNPSNPLKEYKKITKLKVGSNVISLV